MVKIGFECDANGGPGIFLTRLKTTLEAMGHFSPDQPDVWLQLSHKPLPETIDFKKTKLLVRTAGGYYHRHYLINTPFILPLPLVDDWKSRKINDKRNKLIRNNLLQANNIIFQSDFAYRMTHRFITSAVSGVKINNGVDTSLFTPGRKPVNEKRDINILVSHAFRRHKRLHEAIRVFKTCVREAPSGIHLKLHVVGGDNGEVFSEIATMIKAAHLEDHIQFWGQIKPADLPQVYNQCDLMLALPLWDPCPNTVIEALSCGLPVVTTSAGGIPELIGQAGIVVDEPLALNYADHSDLERIPKVNTQACAKSIWAIIDKLEEYQMLARERAVSALDIHIIARQYVQAAEQIC